MISSPAISVIVPCYNGGLFLDGLLACLRAQSMRDFEIIIVDDGSTDAATLKKLKDIETAARVVHQENRGLPGARNTGFREARAELVLPLDCDDRLEPTFLAEVLDTMRNAADPAIFVFTHMRLIGARDGILVTHCNRFDQLFLNHLPYALLVSKKAWQAVGGYDESMRDGMEDWEFNIRLLQRGYRGVEVPRPLFIYAVRPDGMLLSKSARSHATIWRRTRLKHPELYRVSALFSAWRASRPGWRSTLRAALLLTLARVLPETWCNTLFFQMNLLARKLRGTRGEPAATGFAV